MRLNRSKLLWGTLIGATLLVGCGDVESRANVDAQSTATSTPNEAKLASNTAQIKAQAARAVVRKAELEVRTTDVEASEKRLTQWVSAHGGFVAESKSTRLDDAVPTVSMRLRVPVAQFDAAMAACEAEGDRLQKSISGEDVTTQLVDYEARLKIMRAQEAGFRNLLNKAESTSALMDAQSRLMNLRQEIESMAAQRAALANLASLSTVEVTLVGAAKGIGATSDRAWAKESWNVATSAMGASLQAVGSLGIFLAVFSPFWAPFVWLIVRSVKRNAKAPASSPLEKTHFQV